MRMAYTKEIQDKAIKLYYEGLSGRAVGRVMGINKSTVVRWIKKRAEKIQIEKANDEIIEEVIEMDELFSFESNKKN